MKTIRAKGGPFARRPYFSAGDVERMCTSELRRVGLFPSQPEPIRVDRFIEKRFGIVPRYERLPRGVLGFTLFGPRGVEEIVVSSDLEGAEESPAERRLRSTLAHEGGGHALMHAHLFALGADPGSLFGEQDASPKILCRDVAGETKANRGYDGRWWEVQANMAIGALLMPRPLVEQALDAFCEEVGSFGHVSVPAAKMEAATSELARVFNVNPAVVRIRLKDLLPDPHQRQLHLSLHCSHPDLGIVHRPARRVRRSGSCPTCGHSTRPVAGQCRRHERRHGGSALPRAAPRVG
jgi:hypothetical protein